MKAHVAGCDEVKETMDGIDGRGAAAKNDLPERAWSHTAHSLWEATANPRPATPVLDDTIAVDAVIIGAGYLGLNAALTLRAGGADVAVLDAESPGFGASSRNGGQVIPGLKYDPDALLRMYGTEEGDRLIEFVGGAADTVFKTIAQHGIRCDALQNGWIQGAHNTSALALLRQRAAQWEKRGAPVEFLEKARVDKDVGCASNVYLGGWRDKRAGVIHPLNYVLGLAEAAQRSGVHVFSRSHAAQIARQDGKWLVHTASGGRVVARQVVIATNAYSDTLWPKLRLSVIPAQSFQIATDPLPPTLRKHVLRGGVAVSDARRLLHYYRLDAAGRFVMGGRGSLSLPSGPSAFKHIERAMTKTFPSLAGIPVRHVWAGRLAMTRDGLPHLHQPAPGITIALGCNGRGIALTTAIGQRIGAHLLDSAPLPFAASPITPIPLHGLHRSYVTALVQYYKIRDRF